MNNVTVEAVASPAVTRYTFKQFKSSMLKGNSAYIARTTDARLDKNGLNPDVAGAIALAESLTPAQWETLNTLGIGRDFLQYLTGAPLKGIVRGMGFIKFLVTGDHRVLKASARVAVLATGALATCDVKTLSGLKFACTGRGDMNTSDEVSVQKVRANIGAILGRTSPASFATQKSATYGRNGLCCALGMGEPAPKGGIPKLNAESPLTVATVTAIANLSQIAIDDLREAMTGDDSE